MDESKSYEGWAILELMGHRRLGGYVAEQEMYGGVLLRIDVPGEDNQVAATQFYGCSAIYCLTPTTEEIARAVAVSNRPTPVQRWELPAPDPVYEAQYPPDEPAYVDDLDDPGLR